MKEETRRFSFVGQDAHVELTLHGTKAIARVSSHWNRYPPFSCDASTLYEAEEKLRACIKDDQHYRGCYLRRLKRP